MTELLDGEYEPSPAQWVRDQVETYEASGGREANVLRDNPDWPIVVITSRGAKSGKLRKNPVMRVEKDGVYVAIASKGGAPEDPAWVANFEADPVVQLQDGPEPALYRARRAEGAERREYWDHAVATWSTYASYQEKTDREIPVFLLEPVA
ncbi:nitroreductase family deazaflavin-dependent oxidoreductase [Nocardioides stalactiti]|uniref:nitroreductase family deazaflavin-dependent oxidoreductase n=1 Tax=Nocardioides stalactiti TaxID=2755356 RepID=UPI001600ED43|nr:nitroreductase family deazaflavin-dependent oxidoreductase [Nocardioides stalactiti]